MSPPQDPPSGQTHRNLRRLLLAAETMEPRQQFYYGDYHHRWEALDVFERFLEEGQGWVENNIDACCHCAYCHKELGHEQSGAGCAISQLHLRPTQAEVCCEIGNCFLRQERYQQLPTGTLCSDLRPG